MERRHANIFGFSLRQIDTPQIAPRLLIRHNVLMD